MYILWKVEIKRQTNVESCKKKCGKLKIRQNFVKILDKSLWEMDREGECYTPLFYLCVYVYAYFIGLVTNAYCYA